MPETLEAKAHATLYTVVMTGPLGVVVERFSDPVDAQRRSEKYVRAGLSSYVIPPEG